MEIKCRMELPEIRKAIFSLMLKAGFIVLEADMHNARLLPYVYIDEAEGHAGFASEDSYIGNNARSVNLEAILDKILEKTSIVKLTGDKDEEVRVYSNGAVAYGCTVVSARTIDAIIEARNKIRKK